MAERRAVSRDAALPSGSSALPLRCSIIVPVLDEAAIVVAALQTLAPFRHRGAELIVADGQSRDSTAALAAPLADGVVVAARGRGRQMNAGAACASGDVLLFLHADTVLPADALAAIDAALRPAAPLARDRARPAWGRFDVEIGGQARLLKVVATLMNWRSRWSGIATGDQALFMTRAAFDAVGGFPEQPLMEDIEICRRLRRLGPPACLRQRVITSGRRWEQRGVWRTIALMWRLRLCYWLGAAPERLARSYR